MPKNRSFAAVTALALWFAVTAAAQERSTLQRACVEATVGNPCHESGRVQLETTLPIAPTQASSGSKPALTTQDYIDIQQLIARYAVAIDECTNNGYDYAALYADDGWFSASRDGKPGRKWQGRENLAAAARGNMKTCDEVPWKGIKHMYVNHVITPTAEGATGRIDLIAIGLDGDPHKVEHQGHYEDVYVKTPRGWLFRSRLHVLSPGQAEVSSGQKPGGQR